MVLACFCCLFVMLKDHKECLLLWLRITLWLLSLGTCSKASLHSFMLYLMSIKAVLCKSKNRCCCGFLSSLGSLKWGTKLRKHMQNVNKACISPFQSQLVEPGWETEHPFNLKFTGVLGPMKNAVQGSILCNLSLFIALWSAVQTKPW